MLGWRVICPSNPANWRTYHSVDCRIYEIVKLQRCSNSDPTPHHHIRVSHITCSLMKLRCERRIIVCAAIESSSLDVAYNVNWVVEFLLWARKWVMFSVIILMSTPKVLANGNDLFKNANRGVFSRYCKESKVTEVDIHEIIQT